MMTDAQVLLNKAFEVKRELEKLNGQIQNIRSKCNHKYETDGFDTMFIYLICPLCTNRIRYTESVENNIDAIEEKYRQLKGKTVAEPSHFTTYNIRL